METIIWWFIVPLAAWRLTSIIHQDRIAQPLRRLFGERQDKVTGLPTYPDTFFGYLIACFRCLSVWIGIFSYIIFLIFPYVLIPLAISGAIMLIEDH